jgi:hypothetical protein
LKRLCCLTYSRDPRKETEIEAAQMTTVFLPHPLLLAVCLFVFLLSVVETLFASRYALAQTSMTTAANRLPRRAIRSEFC